MKRNWRKLSLIICLTVLSLTLLVSIHADEGMWLFNNPPRKQLKEKYRFEVTNEWLEHVQKSSVRFNSGGSGSFVSRDGLVMSNHHVGADCLQKLSDEQHDYYRDGFHTRALDEEKRCHDLELNVLMSIEDVSERVNESWLKASLYLRDIWLKKKSGAGGWQRVAGRSVSLEVILNERRARPGGGRGSESSESPS